MIRIVLDTNVVVSAHLNEQGLEAAVMELVFAGEVQAFVSESILKEYELTLRRPKFSPIGPERAKRSLADLRSCAIEVEPKDKLAVSGHEADNRFLDAHYVGSTNFSTSIA